MVNDLVLGTRKDTILELECQGIKNNILCSSVLGAWRDMCYYWIIWLWKNQSFGRHFQRCFYSILIFIFANFSPIIVYTSLLSHNPTHFANPNFFTQYSNSEAVIYVG